jgi:hypothetical protein
MVTLGLNADGRSLAFDGLNVLLNTELEIIAKIATVLKFTARCDRRAEHLERRPQC